MCALTCLCNPPERAIHLYKTEVLKIKNRSGTKLIKFASYRFPFYAVRFNHGDIYAILLFFYEGGQSSVNDRVNLTH